MSEYKTILVKNHLICCPKKVLKEMLFSEMI